MPLEIAASTNFSSLAVVARTFFNAESVLPDHAA
jgi:hypothetical protein